MITIGIRAAPAAVTFAVYDSKQAQVLNLEQIAIPAAFQFPDALKFLRSNLLDVLREYSIEKAGVRTIEPNADRPNVTRIQIEGVIQEAFASSGLSGYYVGQISSISARVGFDRTKFKKLVSGEEEYSVENWENMSSIEREAVLCAIGAANV